MSNWKTSTIGELVDNNIIFPPIDGNHGEIHPKGSDFINTGIPFIMASDINNGVINFENCKFISKDQADSLRKGFSKVGDVLLTHKATIGRTALVRENPYPYLMLTPQVTLYRIKDTETLDNVFLKYYFDFQPFQDSLSLLSGAGSTRAYLGIIGQRNLKVSFPDIKIQRKIAKILSLIDDKIFLNNKLISNLSNQARFLFDYYFLNFNFPDKDKKPYKIYNGSMVYNEILKKKIPTNWEIKSLSQIANITMGQSPEGDSYNDRGDGTIFYQGSTDFGDIFPKVRQYTTEPARMAKKGDILLSVRAPVGDMNIANTDCCIGRGLAALNSKDGFDGFLFYVMKYFKQVFDRRNSEGTTFGSITKNDLYSLKLAYPPKELLEKYDNIVSKYNEMIFIRSMENQKLEELRDWLLPMLMNGQISIRDAEEHLAKTFEQNT